MILFDFFEPLFNSGHPLVNLSERALIASGIIHGTLNQELIAQEAKPGDSHQKQHDAG
jgi:hypothetical protein